MASFDKIKHWFNALIYEAWLYYLGRSVHKFGVYTNKELSY